MDWTERFGIALVVAIVIGLVALLVYAVREENRWDASCEARGGVPFHPRGDRICVDSTVVR